MNMKTPEEYFKEQSFGPEGDQQDFTSAEKAFLKKYLGLDEQDLLDNKGLPAEEQHPVAEPLGEAPAAPAPEPASAEPSAPTKPSAPAKPAAPAAKAPTAPAPAPAPKPAAPVSAAKAAPQEEPEPEELDLAGQLRRQSELQMVSFRLGSQEFTVPISVVQEVIRYQQHTKLPAAPDFLAGIVNLRGRVTPLIRLRKLMGVRSGDDESDKFIVVCRRKGLQLGLMIESVATMYRVTQDKIEWGVESNLGINADLILGLMKSDDERLISIISVDHIVEKVIKS